MKATCAVCRRHRVIMANKQLCLACAVGLTHRCPICQDVVPGSGHAPCYPCSQHRRANRQIATDRETIQHPWLADLFSDFCLSGKIPLETGIATDRIARAAAACRRIAVTVTNPTDLSTETLHAALGAESLRRVAPMIAYWAEIGVIEWDRARLQTLIERDRVTAILTTHAKSPHAPLLHRYRDHLAIRDRKPITQRTALTAAVTLLAALGDAPIADLTQRHVTSMLRARPGHRASLQGFLSFIASEGGPRLTIAKPRQDPVAQERRLRADIRACRKRLQNPRTLTETRALIAVLIARVYALPLNRVLSLKRPEVAISMNAITLWPDGEALALDRSLAVAFQEWISLGGCGARRDTPGSSPAATVISLCPRPPSRIIWLVGRKSPPGSYRPLVAFVPFVRIVAAGYLRIGASFCRRRACVDNSDDPDDRSNRAGRRSDRVMSALAVPALERHRRSRSGSDRLEQQDRKRLSR